MLEPADLVVDTVGKGLAWYEVDVCGESNRANRPGLGAKSSAGCSRSVMSSMPTATHSPSANTRSWGSPCVRRRCSRLEPRRTSCRTPRHLRLTGVFPDEDVAAIDDLVGPFRERGVDVSVTLMQTYEASEISADEEIATVVRRYSRDVAGVDTVPHGKNAATDQRNFVNDAGIPAIIWGPGRVRSPTRPRMGASRPACRFVKVLCRTVEDL